MAAFGRALYEVYGVYHVYCSAHVLELTTGMAFNIEGAFECMKGARGLVGHFNSSSQATSDLLKIQVRSNPLTIVQDVATRWWSTFSMINRLLELKESFSTLVRRDLLSQDMNLTDEQWDALNDIKALLEPFMIVQKVLEGQKYPTASLVPYLIKKVRDGLEKVALHNRLPAIRDLASKMLTDGTSGFNTYWGSGAPGTIFDEHSTMGPRNRQKGCPLPTLIASALDPRLKHLPFLNDVDKAKVWSAVLTLMREFQTKKNAELIVAPLDVPVPLARVPLARAGGTNMLIDMFEDLYDPTNEERDDTAPESEGLQDDAILLSILKDELLHYQTMKGQLMMDGPDGPRDISAVYTNQLHWWARSAAGLPHLSVLAKQFLCIPSTSAPSERVFSAAGLTITKSRASLHPDNASDLIFLHNSWPYAEKYNLKRKAEEQEEKNAAAATNVTV